MLRLFILSPISPWAALYSAGGLRTAVPENGARLPNNKTKLNKTNNVKFSQNNVIVSCLNVNFYHVATWIKKCFGGENPMQLIQMSCWCQRSSTCWTKAVWKSGFLGFLGILCLPSPVIFFEFQKVSRHSCRRKLKYFLPIFQRGPWRKLWFFKPIKSEKFPLVQNKSE